MKNKAVTNIVCYFSIDNIKCIAESTFVNSSQDSDHFKNLYVKALLDVASTNT